MTQFLYLKLFNGSEMVAQQVDDVVTCDLIPFLG